jgi:hypothetical protein
MTLTVSNSANNKRRTNVSMNLIQKLFLLQNIKDASSNRKCVFNNEE